MSDFNWSNYIGEHMDKPLRVKFSNITIDGLIGIPDSRHINIDNKSFYTVNKKDCKPLIKSPADLTDEELSFIANGKFNHDEHMTCVRIIKGTYFEDYKIVSHFQTGEAILEIHGNRIGLAHGGNLIFANDILNRLYSLHISLDYEELIRTKKAVRK